MSWRIVAGVAVVVAGCRAPVAVAPAPAPASAAVAPAPAPVAVPRAAATVKLPPPLSGPPLDEASARFSLARRFRAAGLRIREDVPLALAAGAVTLDGYDPAARVGYEYVAEAEAGVAPSPALRAALAGDGRRVLIIDTTDAAGLDRAVASFLAGLETPSSPLEDDTVQSPSK